MGKRAWAALATSVSLVSTQVGTTRVGAGNWFDTPTSPGTCNGLRVADSKFHNFYYYDLTPAMAAQVDNHRQYLEDIGIGLTAPRTFTLSSSTDAVVYDFGYTTWCQQDWSEVAGYTSCTVGSGTSKCDRHDIRLDTNDYSSLGTAGKRFLACHESGHSLGLAHSLLDQGQFAGFPAGAADSCVMNYPPDASYINHEKSHLQGL